MERNFTVKEMPPEERPYEKFLRFGPKKLSDAELLAVVLRTGTRGQRCTELALKVLKLLQDTGGGLAALHHMSLKELTQIKGIGKVKGTELLCIAELAVRLAQEAPAEAILFDCPGSIADYYMEKLCHEEKEQVRLVLLNGKNRYINDVILSVGTVNASLMSPREIFIEALRQGAAAILLIHNHPSGDPTPSRQDVTVTRKVWETGKLLEVPLLDHLIIGKRKYVSLREEGLL